MPILIQRLNVFLTARDRPHTFTTFDGEQIFEALFTIWFPRIHQESFVPKPFVTEGAHEVVWVPALSKRVDTVPDDCVIAVSAFGSVIRIVTLLAEQLIVLFDERLILEGRAACRAAEVIRVPGLSDGTYERPG